MSKLTDKEREKLLESTFAFPKERKEPLVDARHIQPTMRLVGTPLREAQLPAECLVVSIRRDGELLFPRGSVVILAGDVVTFLVSPRGEERLQQYLAIQTESVHPVSLG